MFMRNKARLFNQLFGRLVLTAFLSGCGVSQHFVIESPEKKSIELPIDLSEDYPFVTVNVQGHDIPLLLDLGGFSTIAFGDSILSTLKVEYTGSRSFSDAYGTSFKVRNYVIPSAEIGGLKLKNIEATEIKYNQNMSARAKNGYIGIGFLKKFKKVIFDYPNRKMILLQEEALPSEYQSIAWSSHAMSGSGDVHSKVIIDGKEVEFLWDTGASYSVIHREVTAPDKIRPFENMEAYTATSMKTGNTELGPNDFILLDFSEPDVDGIIGHNYFAKHKVLIDFENRTIGVN